TLWKAIPTEAGPAALRGRPAAEAPTPTRRRTIRTPVAAEAVTAGGGGGGGGRWFSPLAGGGLWGAACAAQPARPAGLGVTGGPAEWEDSHGLPSWRGAALAEQLSPKARPAAS